jgi:NADPH-dependent 2,4-dienoyl-CoA reductase/sulfur reductase-like enzyme
MLCSPAATPGQAGRNETADFGVPHPSSIVIVGSGAAGSAAVATLRRCNYAGPITIIDGDDGTVDDRPLPGAANLHDERDVRHVHARARALDVAHHAVRVSGGSLHEYDALLLATGARPRTTNLPGHDLPHVYVLRSLADCRAIVAAAADASSVVILDASVMRLDLAALLRGTGLTVHVLDPDDDPLEDPLEDPQGNRRGAMLYQLQDKYGITFHPGQTAERIEHDAVVLTNGERLSADVVVVGVGALARFDLARAAGLAIDRGVSVNEYLETSVPGIYAAGDIARWPDPHTREDIRVEHWLVSQRQGETAARNMLGARERFDPKTSVGHNPYALFVRRDGRWREPYELEPEDAVIGEQSTDGGRTWKGWISQLFAQR